jgi:hypothetical protein
MFKEILQQHVGLGKHQDLHETAPGFSYPNSIDVLNEWYHVGYKTHADSLSKIFKGDEFILELGCGGGNLSYFIRQNHPNIKYVTLDINEDTPTLSPYIDKDTHFVVYTDQPYQITYNDKPVKFDYIISYEHFEYIDPSKIPILLSNIKMHSLETTKIIITVANYECSAHPSGFPKDVWSNILEKNGFEILNESHLSIENCPPNFPFENTNEFILKVK